MKRIDAHKDYVLSNLIHVTYTVLSSMCDIMQEKTPYGKAYEEAFKQVQRTRKAIEKLGDCLAKCQEVKGYGEKNNPGLSS